MQYVRKTLTQREHFHSRYSCKRLSPYCLHAHQKMAESINNGMLQWTKRDALCWTLFIGSAGPLFMAVLLLALLRYICIDYFIRARV